MPPTHEVQQWALDDKTVVLLGVKDEEELKEWEAKLADREVPFETFVEPDRDNEKTALAAYPTEDQKLFKKLKLL